MHSRMSGTFECAFSVRAKLDVSVCIIHEHLNIINYYKHVCISCNEYIHVYNNVNVMDVHNTYFAVKALTRIKQFISDNV